MYSKFEFTIDYKYLRVTQNYVTLENIYQPNRDKYSFHFNYVEECSKNNYVDSSKYEQTDKNEKY